jgi:Na+-driven multidrug efflux pump
LWVGKEIVVSVSLTGVMALYVLINAWNGIFSNFLNGVGKIKLQLYLALGGSLFNIPLAIFFGKTLGIHGVILSTTLISVIASVVTPIQYLKLINNKANGIWSK